MIPTTRADSRFVFHALVLFALFVGGAWAAVRLSSGSSLGQALGPLAAQGVMALVVVGGSRTIPKPDGAARAAARRLRAAPLVLIALGGFLVQVALLAGVGPFARASIAAAAPEAEARLSVAVLLVTSVVGAPLLEELFFRGMLQPLLGRRSVVLGLVATAALFGIAHGSAAPFRAIPTFLHGVVLGAVVLRTGRLRAAVAVHALNNALVVAAMGVLLLRPAVLAGAPGAGGPGLVTACAAIGLALTGWGFIRASRLPLVPSRPAPSLATS